MTRQATRRCRLPGANATLQVLVLVLALGGVLSATPAVAQTLVVPSDVESITVPLPSAAGTLIVELDGYDITAVAVLQQDRLELPARSLDLAAGQHSLRILTVDAAGDISELAEHVLEVQQVSRSSSRRWNVLLGTAHRIAEDPESDFDGTRSSNQRALLELEAQSQRSRWNLRAAGAALYDRARETSPDQALWQTPGYELQASRAFDTGAASVTLGDNALALGNLIFNSFTRRGLRADVSALRDRLQTQVFTLYTDPRTQLDDILPTEPGERAVGGYTTLSPLSRNPEWLRVTAGFVDGEGTLGGATVSTLDPETLYGGHAWNAALDSWTFGNSLWVHLEYAKSRFDSDGIGQGTGEGADDAQQFGLQLSSGGDLVLPGLQEWSIGWQHQVVGPDFFSIGNLLLPGDLEVDLGYLRLGWQGLQLAADLVTQQSDIEDDPLRPRQESKRSLFTASYTPLQIDPQGAPWNVIGTPTFSAEVENVEFEQPDGDALVAGYDLDSTQRTRAFGVDLSGSSLTFGVRFSEIRFEDRSQALVVDDLVIYEPQSDTRERTTTVQLAWNPNPRFMLAPQFQHSRLRSSSAASDGRNDLWGLQAQAELVLQKLWLQASYSETRDRPIVADLLLPEERLNSGGGAANLVYRMRGARGGWPAIDWQLGGQYASSDLQDTWQVHLGFELNWNSEAE